MANRADSLCHVIINGLNVMEFTVDSLQEFVTFATVHGLLVKSVKVALESLSTLLAWVGVILYSVFKMIDFLFIQRREGRYYIPDPMRHCKFMKTNIRHDLDLWLKASEQIFKYNIERQHD